MELFRKQFPKEGEANGEGEPGAEREGEGEEEEERLGASSLEDEYDEMAISCILILLFAILLFCYFAILTTVRLKTA